MSDNNNNNNTIVDDNRINRKSTPTDGSERDTGYGWDVENLSKVYLGENETEMLTFFDEGVEIINKYDHEAVSFQVHDQFGDTRTFEVTSTRLLRVLKKNRPLTGKSFEITRIGQSFETRYQVVEVTAIGQFIGE